MAISTICQVLHEDISSVLPSLKRFLHAHRQVVCRTEVPLEGRQQKSTVRNIQPKVESLFLQSPNVTLLTLLLVLVEATIQNFFRTTTSCCVRRHVDVDK